MITIAALALIWSLAFAIFFVPARMIGTWLVRTSPPQAGVLGVILNICLCFMLAKLAVVIVGVVLVFGRFEVFPRFNEDPQRFGLFFVSVLIFVPALSALIIGYLRARKMAPHPSTQPEVKTGAGMAKLVLWIVATPAAIIAGLFGFDLYRQATDNRPMSLRIHEECVRENGPDDVDAINSCKFRVLQREVNASLDRIERRRGQAK